MLEKERASRLEKEKPEGQKERPAVNFNLENEDEEIVYHSLREPTVAEQTGNFSEQIEQKKAELEAARANYVKEYAAFVTAKKKKEPPEELSRLIELLKQKRITYLENKKTLAETLMAAKKSELAQQEKTPEEIKAGLSEFLRREIFQQLVIDEEKILQEKQAAEWPPEEKGILRRLYEKWDNLSTVKKVLVTSSLATGLAVAGSITGSLGTTGLLLFFSKTFTVNLGQEIFSGLIGLGVNKLLTKKIENSLTEKTEKIRETTSLETLGKLSKRYHQLVEQKAHKSQAALLISALSMVAAGRGFSLGLNFLSNSSLFKGVSEAAQVGFNVDTGVIDKTDEIDTVSKPVKGFFKKIFNVFKKIDVDDIDND